MGQRDGRRRHGRPDAAGGDDEIGHRASVEARSSPRRGGPARPGRRPSAARCPRLRRPTRARCAARACGRGADGGRPASSTRPARHRPRRRRDRRGRPPRPGRPPDGRSTARPPAAGSATARTAGIVARARLPRSAGRGRRRAPASPAPSARRGSSAGRASSSSRSASGRRASGSRRRSGSRRPARAGPRRAGRRRRRTTSRPSDIEPDSTIGISGRRIATAATSVAQLADRAAFVGPRRVARADQDRRRSPRSSSSRGHRERIGRSRRSPPLGRQPLRAAVATSPASVRSEPATTASRRGRRLRTSRRGQRVARRGRRCPRPVGDDRVGRAMRPCDQELDRPGRRRRRPASTGCRSAAMRRRHGRSARPTTVAAPWSIVRKACGCGVTA